MLVFKIPVQGGFSRADGIRQFAKGEEVKPQFIDQEDPVFNDFSAELRFLRVAQVEPFV